MSNDNREEIKEDATKEVIRHFSHNQEIAEAVKLKAFELNEAFKSAYDAGLVIFFALSLNEGIGPTSRSINQYGEQATLSITAITETVMY